MAGPERSAFPNPTVGNTINSSGVVQDPMVLLRGCYTVATRARYEKAADRFAVWCAIRGVNVYPGGCSLAQLDYYLSRYMVYLWYACYGKSEAICTFYGIDMFEPGLRHKLPISLRSIRGYNRLCPSTPYPPLPHTAAVVIAAWLALGHVKHGYAMAVAMVLSFDCYLRAGELLGLIREDVATGRDRRIGTNDDRVHIHLRSTKTGAHKGVEVRDAQVKQLLLTLVKRTKHGQRLFPWSHSTHLKWFKTACAALGLSSDYVHHSLRHGGATRDYLNGMAIADVMVRGRWAANKSAVHYIQQGRQLMMLHDIPQHVDSFGRRFAHRLIPLFAALSQYTL